MQGQDRCVLTLGLPQKYQSAERACLTGGPCMCVCRLRACVIATEHARPYRALRFAHERPPMHPTTHHTCPVTSCRVQSVQTGTSMCARLRDGFGLYGLYLGRPVAWCTYVLGWRYVQKDKVHGPTHVSIWCVHGQGIAACRVHVRWRGLQGPAWQVDGAAMRGQQRRCTWEQMGGGGLMYACCKA